METYKQQLHEQLVKSSVGSEHSIDPRNWQLKKENYNTNPAEQVIQTWENHFISNLHGCDSELPAYMV